MDHIQKNHMFHKPGKSVFFSTNPSDVWAMVQLTLSSPIVRSKHWSNRHRSVYKKNFATPVGRHGISGASCYFVTVIYDDRIKQVVTAFPTV